MRHLSVEIRRSELTTLRILTTRWELPLLQLVHGTADVTVKGEIDDDTPYPTSAKSEYARLEQVYGQDKEDDGRTFVAKVYGDGQGGVLNLGSKIRATITEDRSRPPKAPPPDVVEQDPEDRIENDPDVIEQPAAPPAASVAAKDPLLG